MGEAATLIKTLTLSNFGPVASATVEFGPLNAVVGENNAGKSLAIFRSLACLLNGESLSDDLIRDGKTSCEISLTFADGRRVVRSNTSGTQTTFLIEADGSKTKLSGAKAKDAIREFTGCYPIRLSGKDLDNLQFVPVESGSHWLVVGSSAATVLEKVVAGTGSLGFESARSSLTKRGNELKVLTTARKADVDERTKVVEVCKTLFDDITAVEMVASELDAFAEVIVRLEDQQTRCNRLLDAMAVDFDDVLQTLQILDTAMVELDELQQKTKQLETTSHSLTAWIDSQSAILETEDEINELEVQLEKLTPEICPTCNRPL